MNIKTKKPKKKTLNFKKKKGSQRAVCMWELFKFNKNRKNQKKTKTKTII